MRREEKRRKFHEALLNTLYPPSPQPQVEDVDKPLSRGIEGFDVDLIPDGYGLQESGSSTCDDDGSCGGGKGECENQKLTRAQRKRLRRKKLKKDASSRGQLIGPLLSPSRNDGEGTCSVAVQEDTSDVRRDADERHGVSSSNSGETASDTNKSKMKQRRMAKRVAKERLSLLKWSRVLKIKACSLLMWRPVFKIILLVVAYCIGLMKFVSDRKNK